MAQAGADIVVCHLGLDHRRRDRRRDGADAGRLRAAINAWAKAAKAVNPDVIVLCHGGPIAHAGGRHLHPEHCPECHGFYGASSMERLPTEVALTEQTREVQGISR